MPIDYAFDGNGVIDSSFYNITCEAHEPFIGYDNLFERATVTATSEDAVVVGFAANAYDWLAHDFWQPTANGPQDLTATLPGDEVANYIGIYAYEAGDSDFELYADGALALSIPNAELTGKPIVLDFPELSASEWELRTNSTTDIVKIGVISVGAALPIVTGLRNGYAPPQGFGSKDIVNNISQMGQFIGRSNRKRAFDHRISFDHVPYDWIRGNWHPFIEHYEAKPFFYSWSRNRYPDESAFCWTKGPQRGPQFQSGNLFTIGFAFLALTK